MRRQRGDALVEFALAWPVAVFLTAGGVQLALWSAELSAAQEASLAGARIGQSPAASAAQVDDAALVVLRPWAVGVRPDRWCPGDPGAQPQLWVCASLTPGLVEVRAGGVLQPLLALLPGGRGLPFEAQVQLPREAFQ